MKQIIIVTGILIITIISCRPEPLVIDIDPVESQVVVFSQVIPQLAVTIVLTNTISALEFSQENGDSLSNDILNQLLEDSALVRLSYLDQVDTLVESTKGVYTGIFIPQYENELYQLDITTSAGKELHAESKMLPLVPFTSITPIIKRNTKDTLVKIAYSIEDPIGDNWYMINVYTNNPKDRDTSGINSGSFFGGSGFLVRTRLIDDHLFDSERFSDTMKVKSLSPTDSIVVSISNINETFYDYIKLRKTSQNLFTEITKEPINYPSNVENGLGFFNTHYPDLRYFDLSEF